MGVEDCFRNRSRLRENCRTEGTPLDWMYILCSWPKFQVWYSVMLTFHSVLSAPFVSIQQGMTDVRKWLDPMRRRTGQRTGLLDRLLQRKSLNFSVKEKGTRMQKMNQRLHLRRVEKEKEKADPKREKRCLRHRSVVQFESSCLSVGLFICLFVCFPLFVSLLVFCFVLFLFDCLNICIICIVCLFVWC